MMHLVVNLGRPIEAPRVGSELLLVPCRWPTYCQLVAAAISNVLKHTQMLHVVAMLRSLQHVSKLDELVHHAMKVIVAPNSTSRCSDVATTRAGRRASPIVSPEGFTRTAFGALLPRTAMRIPLRMHMLDPVRHGDASLDGP
jgi:hypothetical protein